MTSVHAAVPSSVPLTPRRDGPPPTDRRVLALRERAVLRLASRQGGVAVVLRRADRTLRDGYDKLDLLAGLSERGLLRWSGLRVEGSVVEAVYALGA